MIDALLPTGVPQVIYLNDAEGDGLYDIKPRNIDEVISWFLHGGARKKKKKKKKPPPSRIPPASTAGIDLEEGDTQPMSNDSVPPQVDDTQVDDTQVMADSDPYDIPEIRIPLRAQAEEEAGAASGAAAASQPAIPAIPAASGAASGAASQNDSGTMYFQREVPPSKRGRYDDHQMQNLQIHYMRHQVGNRRKFAYALFGDNDYDKKRKGRADANSAYGGQAEFTRKYDRTFAFGITTTFHSGARSNLQGFKRLMDKEFRELAHHFHAGGDIIVPCQAMGPGIQHNLGTGIAGLPQAYLQYIQRKIDDISTIHTDLINKRKLYGTEDEYQPAASQIDEQDESEAVDERNERLERDNNEPLSTEADRAAMEQDFLHDSQVIYSNPDDGPSRDEVRRNM